MIDGVYPALNAGNGAGGQAHGVCYAIEGNGARPSHRGRGYSEDGRMFTLNTIEKHSVCYGVDCRNGVLDEEKTHTIQAKPNGGMSVNYTPNVCYTIEGNCVDRDAKQNGSGIGENVSPSLNTQDKHAVCYGLSKKVVCGGGNDGGMPIGENLQPGIVASGTGAICYEADRI